MRTKRQRQPVIIRAMSLPQVLCFDLDDTLWPVAPVIEAAERALEAWLRQHHPRSMHGHTLDSMRALRSQVAARFPHLVHDFTFLRRRALAEQLAAAGCDDALADEALEVFLAERNRVRLYPEVAAALTALRGRHRLFALSNGNADIARVGLAEYFEGHVTARAAGAAKPDARIFHALLAKAGVSAADVLHIGDDPVADVTGARRAGMHAVWLNRDGRGWPAHLEPPARTIAGLAELLDP